MTEVDRLINALSDSPKSKNELETAIGFKSEVKNLVYTAKKKGFQIYYESGKYRLN